MNGVTVPQLSQTRWWWWPVAGADRFVAGHRLADLELLDEVQAFELVEDAVDAGAADRSVALAQRVFDLDRREGAGLGVEQFEQRLAGGAGVVLGLGEDVLRVLGPALGVFPGHRS